jgi:hypothetical protein
VAGLKVSCGSIAAKINHSGHFRLSLNSGSTEDIAVGPFGAKPGLMPAPIAQLSTTLFCMEFSELSTSPF